jgi:hypothetical protein
MKKIHHQGPVPPSANSRGVIHETIATRAYEMWEQGGRPDNQAEAFWLAAECEQVTGHHSQPLREPALPVLF